MEILPFRPLKLLPWSNTSGIRLLSGTMQVEVLPAAPLPGSVKVARRPVKPFGVGASPTLAANLWKAGRYKLAAPVSKTESARAEVGALPTPSAIVP